MRNARCKHCRSGRPDRKRNGSTHCGYCGCHKPQPTERVFNFRVQRFFSFLFITSQGPGKDVPSWGIESAPLGPSASRRIEFPPDELPTSVAGDVGEREGGLTESYFFCRHATDTLNSVVIAELHCRRRHRPRRSVFQHLRLRRRMP